MARLGRANAARAEPSRDRDLAATAADFPLHELALVAAREAWLSSGAVAVARRAGLVFGTCFGQGFKEFSDVAHRIAGGLDLAGPVITISTACASSTNAIGLARDLLIHGHADVVVAGGADTLMREAVAGFSALGVLSSEPCAPFSDPLGTTLGEGAAFLILERADDAARRNAPTWGAICGYGLSADAYHETTPDPSGDGVARAIRGALCDAGWGKRDVDFVSAHATGTSNNDRIEWSVIERELGAGGRPPHVTGSKGHVGHTQGAAGALELVLALICHREGVVPPTLHFRGPRAGCPSDPIAGDRPRAVSVSRALKLSAAFGGANAALSYVSGPPPVRAGRVRCPVVVTGGGVVGPRGAFRLSDVLALEDARSVGRCKEVDLDTLGVDGRRFDPSSRWLTTAAALALPDQRRAERMDTIGLFVAATRMPEESSRRCTDSIVKRGVGGTSASAFARMSVNAPAGACAKALGLLGPTTTVSVGDGSGLLALALAAEWLAWREDGATIIAGGVDEASGPLADETEGAACLALTRALDAKSGATTVASWGIAGPARAHEAAERAMAGRTSVDSVFVDFDTPALLGMRSWLGPRSGLGLIRGSAIWGSAEATRSCVLAAVAVAHVSKGDADAALVVSHGGTSSVAIVFERRGSQ